MMTPISVMMREHGEIWDAMDGLDALLASDADSEGRTPEGWRCEKASARDHGAAALRLASFAQVPDREVLENIRLRRQRNR